MKEQNIVFDLIEGKPSTKQLDDIIQLYSTVFNDADIDFFLERINKKENVLSIIASVDKNPVGFKIGYRYNATTFYSWVGGVLSSYRNKGIAKKLAEKQEKWAKTNNYSRLSTKSMNKYKPMIILNLKNGFDIVQVYTNSKNQTKIAFEKSI
jgi:GNAT superfamily N-acetyltransferase